MNSTLPQFQHLSQSVEDRFWTWFVANETQFYEHEANDSTVANRVESKLQQIDANLTFRFSDLDDQRKRAFIVSAGGVKRSFHAVQRLASKAPLMLRWKVIAFRPRTGRYSVEGNGMTLTASQVWFSHFYGEDKIGLKLYIEGYAAATRVTLVNLAFLLLDDMIGEFDVATKIGYVDIDHLPPDPAALGFRPLIELIDVIDSLTPASPS